MMWLPGKQLWLTPHLFGISKDWTVPHNWIFQTTKTFLFMCLECFLTMLGGNISEIDYTIILPSWTEAARNNISLDPFDRKPETWLKEV